MQKIFFAAIILLFSFIDVKAQSGHEDKLSYREIGSILPPMRVIDTLNNEYSEKDFRNNHHFFMFLFNPTCGHCIQMAKMMGDSLSYFKNNKILFLAGAQMMPYLKSFYEATGVGRYPEIAVGIDSAKTVDRLYFYKALPQLNIYDKNGRLVNIFYGDIPLDSLKQYTR